jgi:cell division septum initiation protein DivIVA
MSWLSPARWLAVLALCAGLMAGYIGWRGHQREIGRVEVRAEYTALALQASEAARTKEQALTATNQRIDRDLQNEKKRRVADAAVSADRLRDFQAALDERGTPSAAASGVNGTGGLERELLSNCAAALVSMAETADQLEGKIVGLQTYTRDVCLQNVN